MTKKSKVIQACLVWEGKLLYGTRAAKPARQKELAEVWGVDPRVINDYLLGKATPPLWRYIFIKHRYKKSWSALGKLIEEDFPKTTIKKLMRKYNR